MVNVLEGLKVKAATGTCGVYFSVREHDFSGKLLIENDVTVDAEPKESTKIDILKKHLSFCIKIY